MIANVDGDSPRPGSACRQGYPSVRCQRSATSGNDVITVTGDSGSRREQDAHARGALCRRRSPCDRLREIRRGGGLRGGVAGRLELGGKRVCRWLPLRPRPIRSGRFRRDRCLGRNPARLASSSQPRPVRAVSSAVCAVGPLAAKVGIDRAKPIRNAEVASPSVARQRDGHHGRIS